MSMNVTEEPITDFIPDPHNANLGSQRGLSLLETSIEQLGLGRSIVTAADGTIIAGNKTHQAAVDKGFTKAIVVETDGTELVVVRRTDIPANSDRAVALAIADNRVSEVDLNWDPEVLAALEPTGVLDDWFLPDELDELLIDTPKNLDELEEEYGEFDERALWPFIRLQVPPDVLQRYEALMERMPGDDDAQKFTALLDAVVK